MLLVLLRAAQEQRTCWASTWLEEAAWSTASPGSRSATVATAVPTLPSPRDQHHHVRKGTVTQLRAVKVSMRRGLRTAAQAGPWTTISLLESLSKGGSCCLYPPLPAPLPSLPKRHSRKLQRKAFDWLQLTEASFIPAEHVPGIPAVS